MPPPSHMKGSTIVWWWGEEILILPPFYFSPYIYLFLRFTLRLHDPCISRYPDPVWRGGGAPTGKVPAKGRKNRPFVVTHTFLNLIPSPSFSLTFV